MKHTIMLILALIALIGCSQKQNETGKETKAVETEKSTERLSLEQNLNQTKRVQASIEVLNLWNKIFTQKQVLSPYLPAIFQRDIKVKSNLRIVDKIKKSEEIAKKRQQELEEDWLKLKPSNSPEYKVLEYIFEHKNLESIQRTISTFPDDIKYEIGRLLISECYFQSGLSLIFELYEKQELEQQLKSKINAFLREYTETKMLADDLSLFFDNNFDLNPFRKEHSEPEEIEEPLIEDFWDWNDKQYQLIKTDDYSSFQYAYFNDDIIDSANPIYFFQGFYGVHLLEKDHGTFWSSQKQNEITLKTKFNGPVEYKLYKINRDETFKSIKPKDLKSLELLQQWQDNSLNEKNNNSHDYTDLNIEVPKLKEGKYLLSVKIKYSPFILLKRILVTDQIIYSRKNKESLDIILLDRLSLEPLKGKELKISQRENNKYTSIVSKTDKNGLISIDGEFPAESVNIFSTQKPLELSSYNDPSRYGYYRGYDDTLSAVWTSSPMYKPGETVQFRGNIRKKGLLKSLPSGKKSVKISIYDTNYKEVWTQQIELTDLGSFHGEFKLPLSSRTGDYHFKVDGIFTGGFKVKYFRLPRFKFEGQNQQEHHPIGQDYSSTFILRHMSGSPLSGEKVTASLGTKTQTYVTDKNGSFELNVKKENLTKNKRNTLKLQYRSPDGQLISDTVNINYFNNPLYLSFRSRHFNKGILYSAELFYNMYDSVTPDKLEFKLFDKSGNLIKSVNPENNSLMVFKNEGVHKIVCTAEYKGYSNTKESHFLPSPFKSTEILTVRCQNTAVDNETVNLDINWLHKNKKEVQAYIFGQNLKTHFRKVITLKHGLNTIPVQVSRKWGPNVHFHAVVFSPELKGNYIDKHCQLKITSSKKIEIAVSSDKQVYKPGEKCSVKITCKSIHGAPLANSELSVSVLNESLFMNNNYKPLDQIFNDYYLNNDFSARFGGKHDFYKTMKWQLGVARIAPHYFNLIPHYLHSMIARYGGNSISAYGGKGRGAVAKPRVKFNEVAAWQPLLKTDDKGQVSFSFNYPDTITNWVFDVKVMSAEGIAGEKTHEASTSLDLETDIIIPRIVRSGDKLGIPLQVFNRKSKAAALLNSKVILDNKIVAQIKNKNIQLKQNSLTDGFLMTKIPSEGTLKFESNILTNDDYDSVKRELKITPTGYLNEDYKYIAGSTDKVIQLPSLGIFPETMSVNIEMETSLSSKILNALKRLRNYRYGCAEQTISRFTPLIVVNESLEKIGIESPYKEELPKIIDEGLTRLYRFQHKDGGWKWYETGDSCYRVSTLVLEGLLEAHNQGVKVEKEVIDKGAQYVLSQFNISGSDSDSTIGVGDKTDYLASTVLSRYSYLFNNTEIAKQVKKRLEPLSKSAEIPQELIYLCKTQLNLDLKNEALETYRELMSKPQAFASRKDVIQAGTKLELIAKLDSNFNTEPIIDKLSAVRSRGWWYDTRATHLVIRGLSYHIKNLTEKCEIGVFLNGKKVGRISDTNLSLKLKRRDLVGAKLLFKNFKKQKYNAHVKIRSYGSKKLKFKSPQAHLTGVFREFKSQNPLNSRTALSLSKDKFYTYELHVESKVDLKFARISIPRPAGIELLSDPKLREGIVSFEEYDDSFNFFVEELPKGKFTLQMHFKADLPGQVFAPLPELDSMYGDPIKTNSFAPEKWLIK